MACISTPTALLIGGGLSAGTGLFSALLGSGASKSAAKTQANAANAATAATLAMFGTTRAGLLPYMTGGSGALSTLGQMIGLGPQMKAAGTQQAYQAFRQAQMNAAQAKTPAAKAAAQRAVQQALQALQAAKARPAGPGPDQAQLTKPFQPTMQQLEQTPGYQFTLQQGENAVKNSFAAQGLGASGSEGKGIANYAENLASTTYQQQFQNYLGQNQQIYNMLGGVTNLGESAAAQVGNQGLGFQSQANATSLAGAGATASGIIGSASSLAGGLNALGSAGSNTAMLLALQNAGMFTPGK